MTVGEHIKLREGIMYNTYLDTTGNLTGGVGHLLTPQEAELYPEGTALSADVVDTWCSVAVVEAKRAAQQQAKLLSNLSPELVGGLVSVNFQLGSNWYKEHKKTWALLVKGKYFEAAVEAADSKWYRQTPVRVEDFQQILINEAKKERAMKEKLIKLGKQPTTWMGLVAVLGAVLGLPTGSGEQLATLLAGVVGIIYPEKVEPELPVKEK